MKLPINRIQINKRVFYCLVLIITGGKIKTTKKYNKVE